MVLTQKAYAPQSRLADLALFLKVMCQISGANSLTCHIPKDTVLMTTYPKSFVAFSDLCYWQILELGPIPYWQK